MTFHKYGIESKSTLYSSTAATTRPSTARTIRHNHGYKTPESPNKSTYTAIGSPDHECDSYIRYDAIRPSTAIVRSPTIPIEPNCEHSSFRARKVYEKAKRPNSACVYTSSQQYNGSNRSSNMKLSPVFDPVNTPEYSYRELIQRAAYNTSSYTNTSLAITPDLKRQNTVSQKYKLEKFSPPSASRGNGDGVLSGVPMPHLLSSVSRIPVGKALPIKFKRNTKNMYDGDSSSIQKCSNLREDSSTIWQLAENESNSSVLPLQLLSHQPKSPSYNKVEFALNDSAQSDTTDHRSLPTSSKRKLSNKYVLPSQLSPPLIPESCSPPLQLTNNVFASLKLKSTHSTKPTSLSSQSTASFNNIPSDILYGTPIQNLKNLTSFAAQKNQHLFNILKMKQENSISIEQNPLNIKHVEAHSLNASPRYSLSTANTDDIEQFQHMPVEHSSYPDCTLVADILTRPIPSSDVKHQSNAVNSSSIHSIRNMQHKRKLKHVINTQNKSVIFLPLRLSDIRKIGLSLRRKWACHIAYVSPQSSSNACLTLPIHESLHNLHNNNNNFEKDQLIINKINSNKIISPINNIHSTTKLITSPSSPIVPSPKVEPLSNPTSTELRNEALHQLISESFSKQIKVRSFEKTFRSVHLVSSYPSQILTTLLSLSYGGSLSFSRIAWGGGAYPPPRSVVGKLSRELYDTRRVEREKWKTWRQNGVDGHCFEDTAACDTLRNPSAKRDNDSDPSSEFDGNIWCCSCSGCGIASSNDLGSSLPPDPTECHFTCPGLLMKLAKPAFELNKDALASSVSGEDVFKEWNESLFSPINKSQNNNASSVNVLATPISENNEYTHHDPKILCLPKFPSNTSPQRIIGDGTLAAVETFHPACTSKKILIASLAPFLCSPRQDSLPLEASKTPLELSAVPSAVSPYAKVPYSTVSSGPIPRLSSNIKLKRSTKPSSKIPSYAAIAILKRGFVLQLLQLANFGVKSLKVRKKGPFSLVLLKENLIIQNISCVGGPSISEAREARRRDANLGLGLVKKFPSWRLSLRRRQHKDRRKAALGVILQTVDIPLSEPTNTDGSCEPPRFDPPPPTAHLLPFFQPFQFKNEFQEFQQNSKNVSCMRASDEFFSVSKRTQKKKLFSGMQLPFDSALNEDFGNDRCHPISSILRQISFPHRKPSNIISTLRMQRLRDAREKQEKIIEQHRISFEENRNRKEEELMENCFSFSNPSSSTNIQSTKDFDNFHHNHLELHKSSKKSFPASTAKAEAEDASNQVLFSESELKILTENLDESNRKSNLDQKKLLLSKVQPTAYRAPYGSIYEHVFTSNPGVGRYEVGSPKDKFAQHGKTPMTSIGKYKRETHSWIRLPKEGVKTPGPESDWGMRIGVAKRVVGGGVGKSQRWDDLQPGTGAEEAGWWPMEKEGWKKGCSVGRARRI